MSTNNLNLIFTLVLIHIIIITLSNALVAIPLNLYGYKLTWAAFSFPLVIVTTDLTVRLLGKSIARKTITLSYPLAIISSVLVVYIEGNLISIAFRIAVDSVLALCDLGNARMGAKAQLFSDPLFFRTWPLIRAFDKVKSQVRAVQPRVSEIILY